MKYKRVTIREWERVTDESDESLFDTKMSNR